MSISGFTIVRNGMKFDYPFRESIRSLLPLVDELIINVGKGEDGTLAEVKALQATSEGQKILCFESDWPLNDPEKKKSGLILSEQTNLALDRCTGDWCVYLQADEILHEDDLLKLRQQISQADDDVGVDALVFNWLHFYGSYDVIQKTRSSYRREIRCVRRASGARSVGDAQSFRGPTGEKLRARLSQVRVFHYGWVRTPEAMREKTYFLDQLYHGDPNLNQKQTLTPHTGDNYRYKRFWGLKSWKGSHPAVMRGRIEKKGWHWDLAHSPFEWIWSDWKKIVLDCFEFITGIRLFEYRSYKLVK